MIWGISFALFCFLTIWLAWRASMGIDNIRHYLLSHQNFSQFALFSTIVASFVGGGVVIGTAEKSFQFGIGHALGLLGFSLQLILTGWWIAPRIGRFRDAITLGEVIARYYGKMPQVLTGILWLSFCIGILSAQMSAMGNLITSLLGYDRTFSILLSASIVIFYCYVGGIRAVVATDLFQFFFLTLALVIVSYFGIQALNGWHQFIEKLPPHHLSPTSYFSPWELGLIFSSFLLGDLLIPPAFQRLLMGKSVEVARKAYIWAGLFIIPICFLAMSHGFIAYAMSPDLPKEEITAFLFQHTLSLPFAIIALFGFMAVIMSSADSYLNAAAGALVNDLITPVVGKSLTKKQMLSLAKWSTIILGSLSIFFAVAVQDILDILLKTYQFWGPTLVIPLLGIFSNRPLPVWGFYCSVLAGGLTVVMWNTFDLEIATHFSALIAGFIANAFVYISIYFGMKLKVSSPLHVDPL